MNTDKEVKALLEATNAYIEKKQGQAEEANAILKEADRWGKLSEAERQEEIKGTWLENLLPPINQ